MGCALRPQLTGPCLSRTSRAFSSTPGSWALLRTPAQLARSARICCALPPASDSLGPEDMHAGSLSVDGTPTSAAPPADAGAALAAAATAAAALAAAAAAAAGPPPAASTASRVKLRRVEAPLQVNGPLQPCSFRVLTLNILADGLAQHGNFVKVMPEVLTWEYRLPLIIAEVAESGADVVCLQEANHFEQLQRELQQLGYTGCFMAKRPAPAERYGCPADGMALFWRPKRFTLVDEPMCMQYADAQGKPLAQGLLRLMLADELAGRRRLCVATTHLKAKGGCENEATRVSQVKQMLQQFERASIAGAADSRDAAASTSCNDSGQRTDGVPIILCGDFNTEPHTQPCQVLASHPLGLSSMWDVAWAAERAVNGLQPGCALPAASNGTGAGGSAAPEFSTWKYRPDGEARRIIDYIWFSAAQLAATRRWRMLTAQEIGDGGLPCPRYASDHVALCCEFAWRAAAGKSIDGNNS